MDMNDIAKSTFVIRMVEDSPDWLDQRLTEAYLSTIYAVENFNVIIGQRYSAFEEWLSGHSIKSYAFITAWNPASRILPEPENIQRNKSLEADLQKVSGIVLPARHIALAGNWPPEESLWAGSISDENAILLGRKYGQNAIVRWKEGGVPELWWLAKNDGE